jgi:hypothetical protein
MILQMITGSVLRAARGMAAQVAARPWLLLLGASAVLALLWWRADVRGDRLLRERDAARALAADEAQRHRTTKQNYVAAQAAAQRAALANVKRVLRERGAVNERIIDELENRRGAADDRYRRLRAEARTRAARDASDADLSASAEATCRAYAAASCDAIPSILKAAQDNSDQLILLQNWVRATLAIPTAQAESGADAEPGD